MQVEHPICCGIDVHKDTLTARLRWRRTSAFAWPIPLYSCC
jgi:hypothetical protein